LCGLGAGKLPTIPLKRSRMQIARHILAQIES
jgi:hypothetical protein